ncbi:MAG: hypothetical protein ACXWVF_00090 [Telluria sp.]
MNRYGLFGLDRKIRPVGEAYRELIKTWAGEVKSGLMCLRR